MREEGPCIPIVFLLLLLISCLFEEIFDHDSSLLELLDATAGAHTQPPTFPINSFMLILLHVTNSLLHSPAVPLRGALSFILPPGQQKEGWIPWLLIFFCLGVSAGAFIQVTVSSKWDDLLGGQCGRTAVASIVMAIGPVVDSVTPTICLERLT